MPVVDPIHRAAPDHASGNHVEPADRQGAEYCDGCRDALDPGGAIVRTVALIPVVRDPLDGPSWIYHPDCVPPEDGTWTPVFRGRLQAMPGRISRASATGRR